MSHIKVNFIGAGRVGKTLIGLLDPLPECAVQDVLSATPLSAQEAVALTRAGRAVSSFDDLRPADLWILPVPDTQISGVAAKLEMAFRDQTAPPFPPVAIHCSGYYPADQMAPLRRLNWLLASVHPVLSFADPMVAMTQFQGALCGLEGDQKAKEQVQPLFEKLGATCFDIRSDSKNLYHAAAVFSNNFTVILQAIAQEAWVKSGLPDNIVQQLNASLLDSTAKNTTALGPQQALTGPAARGDKTVVSEQGAAVATWHPAAGSLYAALSELAEDLKIHGSTRKRN